MGIENDVRQALHDLAQDTPSTDGLAATALRRARRRRYMARTAVAGTAAATVTIPAGMVALANFTSGSGTQPASTGLDAPEPRDADPTPESPAQSDIRPAPEVQELDVGEIRAALDTCRQAAGGGYDDWEPAFGVTIETDAGPGVPATWIGARRGDDVRADCVLDASGQFVSGGGVYGGKSSPALLYAPVDGQEGTGVGRYVDSVARVTVQYDGGPERAAAAHNGFWFAPIDENRAMQRERDEGSLEKTQPSHPDHDLIGVPPGYTFRGYDSDGELVYDSSTDGPSVDDCYADPSGTEFVGNWAGHDDPSECVRTHQWEPLS